MAFNFYQNYQNSENKFEAEEKTAHKYKQTNKVDKLSLYREL